MVLLRLALGLFLVILGLAYLFHPALILRINAFMRERIFRDSHVLFGHRRVGGFLLIIGFLWIVVNLKALP